MRSEKKTFKKLHALETSNRMDTILERSGFVHCAYLC